MMDQSFDGAVGYLRALVIDHEGILPVRDIALVSEFLEVGELGLAYEHLCEQLYEHEVDVDSATVERLAELGTYFGSDPGWWQVFQG